MPQLLKSMPHHRYVAKAAAAFSSVQPPNVIGTYVTDVGVVSNATTATDDNEAVRQLIERLQLLERSYKLGEVDPQPEDSSASAKRCRTFEEELNDIYESVCKFKDRLLAESPSWYYKFLAIQTESKAGYFDSASPSFLLDRYLLAKELYRKLPRRVPATISPAEIVTLKNMIRVIIAGLEYLHITGDFGTALTYAQDILDFVVNRGLMTKEDPANGTKAVLYYFIGRTLRQRGIDDDNKRAIEYFYRSSESYFDMARQRHNNNVDVVYARTRATVSLALGAGFLFSNTQSALGRAKAEVAQARFAFLKDNGTIYCRLYYYCLELLYASILRAEAGDIGMESGPEAGPVERTASKDKLDQASKILDECEQELPNSSRYFAQVLFNRAKVEMYRGRDHYDRARQCVEQLVAMCHDNSRLMAQVLILKSHLERRVGRLEIALEDAINAYNRAGNHPTVRIEALLARGQAQMARRQFGGARSDFDKALQLNNGANLKITALAYVLLVELAINQKEIGHAFEWFNQVEALIPSVSHGFILRKYRQVQHQLSDLQSDFVIDGDTYQLNYKEYETELQRWLLTKALREDPNVTHVAKRLNVSKKTVYLWLEKFRLAR